MNEKPVIFIPEVREPRKLLMGLLEPLGKVVEGGAKKWSEEELVGGAPGWDALMVTSREQITERVIEAGQNLRIIQKVGVGVENIDIPAATRRKIPVANCPGTNAVAVAELSLSLMLAANRRIPQYMKTLQEGRWREGARNATELTGRTFGIVGFGNIGRELARLLRGFEGRVLAHDAFVPPEKVREGGAEPVDLDTLTRESDYVAIHCTLTPETRHMFDARRLKMMKPTATIVNCARGPVIDEAALVEALETGVIAAAGLDVFEVEPPSKDNPLFSMPNVVVTPHLGGSTEEARDRIYHLAADNIRLALSGQKLRPPSLLNPEIYGNSGA